MSEILGEHERRLAVTFEFERADATGEKLARVMTRMLDAFPGEDPDRPDKVHLAISRLPFSDLEKRIGEWTRHPTEEEAQMGIVKHGEGSVIPDPEHQKTASKMTDNDREALAQENADADGGLGERPQD